MPRTTPRAKRAPKMLGTVSAVLIIVVAVLLQRYGYLPSGTTQPAPTTPAPTSQSDPTPSSGPKPTTSHTQATPASTIRIGSWNIEWLGKPDDRSGPAANVAQTPADIADYILAADVSVLALQEIIASVNSRPIRSREIEATIDLLEQKSRDNWEYFLFPGRQDGDQLTGVLWNASDITALDAKRGAWDQLDTPMVLPIPRGRSASGSALWNRPPHAMHFSAGDGRTDFAIVVLHMKADYQGDFASHRADEADALTRALPQVVSTFRETDVVLLGDTNCTDPGEPALTSIDKAGYRDTNTAGLATHWRSGAMDKIFVPARQREFSTPQFEVMSDDYLRARRMSPQDFKTRLSDHYMVVVSMQVGPDDD